MAMRLPGAKLSGDQTLIRNMIALFVRRVRGFGTPGSKKARLFLLDGSFPIVFAGWESCYILALSNPLKREALHFVDWHIVCFFLPGFL